MMTETEQQKFDEELHKTALTDLINRAVSGSFIYVIVWALIGYTYGLLKTHPTFYLFYTVLLFLLGVTRIIPKFLSKDFFNKHFKFIKITFEINVIAHSFLFGLLTTYVYHEPELKPLFLAMVLSAAAFIGAGTATLAINKVIRFMFPAAMLLPFLFYLVSHPTKESQLLGIISIVFAVYIILATKNIYNDYWAAISKNALLTKKTNEFKELSITDPLTKLYNRSFLNTRLEEEWRRSCRRIEPITMLFVDLDNFKQINDNYGHAIGDICLSEMAQTLLKHVKRPSDFVIRFGGDEFIVVLINTELSNAILLAINIIQDLRQNQIDCQGLTIQLSCSIGVHSEVPTNKVDHSTLLIKADRALYKAKENGRDRYELSE